MQSGTPLWLSVLLAVGAVLATHLLTTYREWKKRNREVVQKWRDDCERLLTSISDEAIAHYSDPKMLPSTGASSQRLLALLKRLGLRLREVTCVNPSDAKAMTAAIQELRDEITGADDFQIADRQIREANDPLLTRIADIEYRLRQNIAKERRAKS